MKPKQILILSVFILIFSGSLGCAGEKTSSAALEAGNTPQTEVTQNPSPTLPAPTVESRLPTESPEVEPTPTENPPTATPLPRVAYQIVPGEIGDGWETKSLIEADIDPYIINDMVEHIFEGEFSSDSYLHADGSRKYEGIHGIVIIKNGAMVFEEYFNLNERSFTQDTHSVTKSVTSLLVGLAIEHGYLRGVDVKALPYLTDYMPAEYWDENKANISIRDLLTMSSGMDCDDSDPKSKGEQWKMYKSDNWLGYFIDLPSVRPPGKAFAYCSGGVIALGGILERATGMSISDFSEQYLFESMGIDKFGWLEFPWGTSTSGALSLRPRDMAKIGQLMLDNGKWNGQQIVSADWVSESRSSQIDLRFNERQWFDEYGYLWWRGNVDIKGSNFHPYAAWGLGGQLIIIFPKIDTIVVFSTGNVGKDSNIPLRITEKYILPAIVDGAP